jgi:hypothetical protein
LWIGRTVTPGCKIDDELRQPAVVILSRLTVRTSAIR